MLQKTSFLNQLSKNGNEILRLGSNKIWGTNHGNKYLGWAPQNFQKSMGNKIWEKDWAIKLFLVGQVEMMWSRPLIRGPSNRGVVALLDKWK